MSEKANVPSLLFAKWSNRQSEHKFAHSQPDVHECVLTVIQIQSSPHNGTQSVTG